MRLLEGTAVEGESVDDRAQDTIDALRRENRELRTELAEVRADSNRALATLRRQLSPLYRALQDVFGELDRIGVEDAPNGTAPRQNDRVAAVWANWKSKVGDGSAKVIDALLLHGEMNTQQLSIATGYHRTTIPGLIFKLNKLGLINKNGGRFSLKQL